ncbi:MAG: hypothetical protein Q4B05_03965 [Candidatus Saccharibacteria bacterium]|nr:hypothetical protein [Candidatus Saccharibacteria bacterium]
MGWMRRGLLMVLIAVLVVPTPLAGASAPLGADHEPLSTAETASSATELANPPTEIEPASKQPLVADDASSAARTAPPTAPAGVIEPPAASTPANVAEAPNAPTAPPATSVPPTETAANATATTSAPFFPPPAPSPSKPVATTPDIAITAFVGGVRLELVELYNQSDHHIDMSAVSLRAVSQQGEAQQLSFGAGYLLRGRFLSYGAEQNTFRPFAQLPREFSKDISRIELLYRGAVIQVIADIPVGLSAQVAIHKQRGSKYVKQTGELEKDFQLAHPQGVSFYDDELYIPPVNTAGLTITEILTNPRHCLVDEPELGACADFIEVANRGTQPIDLGKYRLRFGIYGDTPSIANTFHWEHDPALEAEIILQPQEVLVVWRRDDGKALSLAAEDRSVWLEDAKGLARYQTVAVRETGRASRRGASWALFDNGWHWAVPTPGTRANLRLPEAGRGASAPEGLAPCPAGQYRHPETKRCRKIVAAKTPAPCREGYYRSEITGRCRSIAAAAAKTLKPCADGYFRNPATGRCKKIAADSEVLKECPEGFERNPVTNRCRKIKAASMPLAEFAPEQVQQVAGAAWGWWVFGGVGLLAAGYGVWQWRWELGRLLRRMGAVFTSGRK